MKSFTIIFLFAVCCVVTGSPYKPSSQSGQLKTCDASVSAFPPDPQTLCCGVNPNSDKIIGGPLAKIDDYPWLALIEYVKNGVTKTPCSGALISGKYVLTGAHCVVGPAVNTLGSPENIRLGEYDTSHDGPDCEAAPAGGEDCTDGVTRIPIEKVIPHPDYKSSDRDHKNDIALIRMTRMAPYTDFIRPICLPTVNLGLREDDAPLFLKKGGWGAYADKKANEIKQNLILPFVTRNVCQAAFQASRLTLWKGQICAGGQNVKDFCRGDGGLPLMYENGQTYEVTGVVSFGVSVCPSEIPTVYTNVFEYNSWIKDTIVA